MEVVYSSHARWPLTPTAADPPPPSHLPKLFVLDSSFNPPTLAHLALATPPSASSPGDALLLLLSTVNVDKVPKPGDATVAQKLEMMVVTAKELELAGRTNVAVGKCTEATFVGKAAVLKRMLREKWGNAVEPSFCFCQGWDTLIRFFDPKYYPPPMSPISIALADFFSTSSISCARRGSSDAEAEFLSRALVRQWRHKLELYDLAENVREISSTKVRTVAKLPDGEEKDETLGKLVLKGVEEIVKRDGLYLE